MKVIYMSKNKKSAVDGLKYLIKNEYEISCVVCPSKKKSSLSEERIIDVANDYDIPSISDTEIYDALSNNRKEVNGASLEDIDLVVSFLFWKKLKKPIIDLAYNGCINFHPAPLPEYRGVGGYNFAILDELEYWGVSAHYVDESFDTGDIIKVNKFNINPGQETAYSLERKSQIFLLDLFKYIMQKLKNGEDLPRIEQTEGRYIDFNEFIESRKINENDSIDEIDRKIRAFWFPPYKGAQYRINGKEYTIINNYILKKIKEEYNSD